MNTLPFENVNPDLGTAGIDMCDIAGKLGVGVCFLDGALFVVSAQQARSTGESLYRSSVSSASTVLGSRRHCAAANQG